MSKEEDKEAERITDTMLKLAEKGRIKTRVKESILNKIEKKLKPLKTIDTEYLVIRDRKDVDEKLVKKIIDISDLIESLRRKVENMVMNLSLVSCRECSKILNEIKERIPDIIKLVDEVYRPSLTKVQGEGIDEIKKEINIKFDQLLDLL